MQQIFLNLGLLWLIFMDHRMTVGSTFSSEGLGLAESSDQVALGIWYAGIEPQFTPVKNCRALIKAHASDPTYPVPLSPELEGLRDASPEDFQSRLQSCAETVRSNPSLGARRHQCGLLLALVIEITQMNKSYGQLEPRVKALSTQAADVLYQPINFGIEVDGRDPLIQLFRQVVNDLWYRRTTNILR